MLVSIRWLCRHVDVSDVDPRQLALDLTLSTAEVESVEPLLPHLNDVVVGRVLTRAPHPDADKLSVCSVDVGDGEPLTIVCGAPNVAANMNVPVAKVGTTLPGDFKIKKSKIRGQVSLGMICSESELAVSEESEGIWVLPEGLAAGVPVAKALAVEDWVIDIDNKSITHRPDLWGHRGIAREVAAIYQRPLKPLDLGLPECGSQPGVPVRVESDACSRYVALEIEGAKPLPSPLWLRMLLLAAGQRSIDQLVDLSNFVMLDIAQPNHTFDRDKVDASGIVVRHARQGEVLTTLDGKDRTCDAADLLICSGDRPVAFAGIMGGAETEVSATTTRLLLEVASFSPTVVRRASARHGLRTDASARFEKHLDPTLPAKGAAHFARLLRQLQPDVRFPSQLSDAGKWEDPACVLRLRADRVRSVLGADIDDERIGEMLLSVGFGIRYSGGTLEVSVPSERATKDVTIEADLIEEVGRLHGYGNIAEQALLAPVTVVPKDHRRIVVRRVQDRLAGSAAFHETISYSFQSDRLLEVVGSSERPHVRVSNPIAEGESAMRRSVVPSLLATLESNRRTREEVRIFEVGKGYLPERAKGGEPAELHHVGLVWAATRSKEPQRFDANTFSHLRAVVEDVLVHLELPEPQWGQFGDPSPWCHPAQWVSARWPGSKEAGSVVAEVGVLSPTVAAAMGLKGKLSSDVAFAQISIDAILEAPPAGTRYRPIPRYPGIKVDVAIEVDTRTTNGAVVEAIRNAGGNQCANVELFDVYEGGSIAAGKKSLAYHVLLQSPKGTLKDSDEQKFLKRLGKELEKIAAHLRDG